MPSRPGIGNDIKKPGVTEHGYDRTPLRAFVSMQQMWKLIVADLAKIRVPILYFHSTEDHVVDELSGQLLHRGASRPRVTEVPLDNSYHVATLDHDAQLIFDQSVEFIRQPRPIASAAVTTPASHRGRRDNGLDSDTYAPVADVDPRLADHLLDVLGLRDVPAYVEPTNDAVTADRLFVRPTRSRPPGRC